MSDEIAILMNWGFYILPIDLFSVPLKNYVREMKQAFLKIASWIYGAGVRFRHFLFDAGVLSSTEYDIPIICVGNITVGGTGKTPAVEMLVRHFMRTHTVAVLSRGYGRKTKGYREVELTDSYLNVGDEPLQIKRKFPNVRVIVCEKRTCAIERMCREYPEINMIIMDDGFQHRYVKPFINIIMVDFGRPIQNDRLLPCGQLRDTMASLHRAHYFLVTKCPDKIPPTVIHEMEDIRLPFQRVYFTRTICNGVHTVFDGVDTPVPSRGAKVIAMSGIGNNEAFATGLKRRYKVVAVLDFEDHHSYRVGDLKRMKHLLDKYPDAVIVMTEKDAVKLFNSTKIPEEIRARLFYDSVEMAFVDNREQDFLSNIENDLRNKHIKNGAYIRGC